MCLTCGSPTAASPCCRMSSATRCSRAPDVCRQRLDLGRHRRVQGLDGPGRTSHAEFDIEMSAAGGNRAGGRSRRRDGGPTMLVSGGGSSVIDRIWFFLIFGRSAFVMSTPRRLRQPTGSWRAPARQDALGGQHEGRTPRSRLVHRKIRWPTCDHFVSSPQAVANSRLRRLNPHNRGFIISQPPGSTCDPA